MSDARALRFLLVDGDDRGEEQMREIVRQLPGEVALDRVATFEAGLEELSKGRHDLGFVDVRLGARDGLDLVREARARGCRAPLILLTGEKGQDLELQALRSGASDYLEKRSLEPAMLDRTVRHALERARTARQLADADRVASIGTLAAGAAHEINNPLATIVANLSFAIETLGPRVDPDVAEALADAQSAARRVAGLVQELRQLLQSAAQATDAVELSEVVEAALADERAAIEERAVLRTALPRLPRVRGEARRLGNALKQLLRNACESIAPGNPQGNEISLSAEVGADRVVLVLRDTGRGIPLDVQRRLFTPFLTTKGVGEGTGLNLALCRATLVSFGGELRVDTQESRGTSVTISLVPAQPDAGSPRTPPAPRRGRVLVVDDDELVATSVRRALAAHDVVSRETVQEALALLASDRGFDVIFCDLMLPGQDGAAFYESLLEISPDLAARTFFLTGGAVTDRTRALLERMPGRVVQKPFSIGELRKLVAARVAQRG